MKKHKQYGFSDFRRYHFNEMTTEEQYQFEKEMLDDSFLREAYEGFELMLTDGVKPDDWKEKLQPGTPVIKATVRRVWPYAAAALLLMISGFLFYQRRDFFSRQQKSASLQDTIHLSVEGILSGTASAGFPASIEAESARIVQTQPVNRKTRKKITGKTGLPGKIETKKVLNENSQVETMQTDSVLDQIIIVGFGRSRGDTSTSFSKNERRNNGIVRGNSPDERLASHNDTGGEVIAVRWNQHRKPKDTLDPHQDTIKPKGIKLPDTDRENWEKYIRRASRNSLIYGEEVRFGIWSPRDSLIRQFTHDELDELREILIKMKKEQRQKTPELSP